MGHAPGSLCAASALPPGSAGEAKAALPRSTTDPSLTRRHHERCPRPSACPRPTFSMLPSAECCPSTLVAGAAGPWGMAALPPHLVAGSAFAPRPLGPSHARRRGRRRCGLAALLPSPAASSASARRPPYPATPVTGATGRWGLAAARPGSRLGHRSPSAGGLVAPTTRSAVASHELGEGGPKRERGRGRGRRGGRRRRAGARSGSRRRRRSHARAPPVLPRASSPALPRRSVTHRRPRPRSAPERAKPAGSIRPSAGGLDPGNGCPHASKILRRHHPRIELDSPRIELESPLIELDCKQIELESL
ncbi:unnamed protein product [Urochloa humidicola]